MKPSEVMQGALEIIQDPERWTKGAFARNKRGTRVPVKDPDACKFCLSGAMERVAGPNWPMIKQCLVLVGRQAGVGVFTLNDGRGHKPTIAALRQAIELAKAEGK